LRGFLYVLKKQGLWHHQDTKPLKMHDKRQHKYTKKTSLVEL